MGTEIYMEEVDNGYIMTRYVNGDQKQRVVCQYVQEVEKIMGEWLRLEK